MAFSAICDESLRSTFLPFIHDHHLMVQHIIAWPYVPKIFTQFLEAEYIPVLVWPKYCTHHTCHPWSMFGMLWKKNPAILQSVKRGLMNATITKLNSILKRCVAFLPLIVASLRRASEISCCRIEPAFYRLRRRIKRRKPPEQTRSKSVMSFSVNSM